MSNQPDIVTKKNASPFPKKTAVRYGETFCFSATSVKVYMGKRSDQLEWEFGDGSGHDLKIVPAYDKNAFMLLPDDIRELPSAAERKPCSLNLFWEWQAPRGKQTQPSPKITKIEVRESDTPMVAKRKQLQQEQHPELFGAVGEEYHAAPIVRPGGPLTDAEREEIAAQHRPAIEQLQQWNKQPDPDAGKTAEQSELDAAFPRISIGDWLALDPTKRPKVQYNSQDVKNVYRDPSYEDGKHYVIQMESHGAGSKLATTLMAIKQENTTVTDNTLEDELTQVANQQATQDKPAANDWITDDNKRVTFWTTIGDICKLHKISGEQKDDLIRELAGGKLHDYTGTANDLIKRYKAKANALYPIQSQTQTTPKTDDAPQTNAEAGRTSDSQSSEPVGGAAQGQATTPAVVDETPVEVDIVDQPKQLATIPNTGLAPLPMVAQWDMMKQQASVLLKSGFLPQSIKTAEQAITIMMMGSALQVDPIVALNNINVIAGKPTVAPQLMLALVRRSGQLESFKVSDDGQCCTVEIKRRGEPLHTEKFSQQDAVAMGLAGKDNWKKQPAVMRKWRAIAAACRTVFSDVVWGIASYTAEEIDPDIVVDYAA